MSTKLEKVNERLQGALRNQRTRVKEREADLVRKGAGAAAAFALGSMKKSGKITSIPQIIPGVPRIGNVAVFATGAAWFMPDGKARQALDGIGEAATVIASYEWGQGNEVAGYDEDTVEGKKKRLQRESADTRARLAALEDQLSSQVQSELSSRGADASAYGPYIDVNA